MEDEGLRVAEADCYTLPVQLISEYFNFTFQRRFWQMVKSEEHEMSRLYAMDHECVCSDLVQYYLFCKNSISSNCVEAVEWQNHHKIKKCAVQANDSIPSSCSAWVS